MSAENNTVSEQQHQLNDDWCFWYCPRFGHKNYMNDDYSKNLKLLGECSTVEQFFTNYIYIQKPTNIESQNKVLFFRKGCTPLWEEWKCGGCWILLVQSDMYKNLNKIWEDLLLGCIGEKFGNSNIIGVVLSIRRNRKAVIEIWMRDRDEEQKIKAGEELRKILDLKPDNLIFYYKDHVRSLTEGSTMKGSMGYQFIGTPVPTPMIANAVNNATIEEIKNLEDLDI
ncbi:hypothetical protein ABPG72_015365 [Tetrahymena utriculariae]